MIKLCQRHLLSFGAKQAMKRSLDFILRTLGCFMQDSPVLWFTLIKVTGSWRVVCSLQQKQRSKSES